MRVVAVDIVNFKGIKNRKVEFDPSSTTLLGANGRGKTTVYDAVCWVLFGKNSADKKAFAVRPQDKHNVDVPNLEVRVRLSLTVGETQYTFTKVESEAVDKRGKVSHPKRHFVNDVPMREKDYKAAIAEIIDEDKFRSLTDLTYMLEKKAETELRKDLCVLAGEYEKPTGYEDLHKDMGSRSMDDYKKVISERKKDAEKERHIIPTRIDEAQLQLKEYAGTIDVEALTAKRVKIEGVQKELTEKKAGLRATEQARQATRTKINACGVRLAEREGALKADLSAVQALIDEKAAIAEEAAKVRRSYNDLAVKKDALSHEAITIKQKWEAINGDLISARADLAQKRKSEIDDTCYACGQTIPEEAQKKLKAFLAAVIDKGEKRIANILKTQLTTAEHLRAADKSLFEAIDAMNTCEDERLKSFEANKLRLAGLDEAIANRPTPDPKKDVLWLDLQATKKVLEAELGAPVGDELAKLESRSQASADALVEVNAALRGVDANKEIAARIEALKGEIARLAQVVMDCDKTLDTITQYKLEDSQALSAAVNGMFGCVWFNLFKTFLNGEQEECCKAIYKPRGVAYADASTGEKIRMGCDVINVYSEQQGVSVPLFVDHAESVSLDLGIKSQVIWLEMRAGLKELRVIGND